MKKNIFALLLALIIICGCSRSLPANTKGQKGDASVSSSESQKPKEEKPPKPDKEPQSEPKQPPEKEPQPEKEPEPQKESNPVAEEERDWRLVLVNPDHPVTEDFKVDLTMTRYGYEVDSRIVDDVDALINAAAKDNVSLLICYGYRTLEQSRQLFEKQLNRQLARGLSQEEALAEAKRWVAPPGTSDHHTGLALDIVTPEHQVLNHEFFNTPAGQWMAAHSWEYGFVIRFPEDKQDITGITYEPWHLRFVGKEHARAMFENNECLEEYVERLYG